VTHADFLTKASMLCPSGMRAALPLPLDATPQLTLPPWGSAVPPPAAAAAETAPFILPFALPHPSTSGANAEQAMSLSN
jgi:hypothetical protein